MNVREKAKNYEAFMSSSSATEREKKRSREEPIDKSGPAVSDNKKMAGGERPKPIPPPRKKKVPERPERSPKVQLRSTCTVQVKSSPMENEKPKPPKKPPPRPAPYQLSLSSPNVPQASTPPKKLPQIIKDTSNVSSSDTKINKPKDHPKRPPPPVKTASLTRKQKPPLPPKPKRPVKPGSEEKSATLPKNGSLKTEDMKSEKKFVGTRTERSLTGPHRISLEKSDKDEEMNETPCNVDKRTKVLDEEGKETVKTDETVKLDEKVKFDEKVKLDENVKLDGTVKLNENVRTTEPEEEKNTKECNSLDVLSHGTVNGLSKNEEISNVVSEGDLQNYRTFENENIKHSEQSIKYFKEEILSISNEQMEKGKNENDIEYEQSFEGKIIEIEEDTTKGDDGRNVDLKNEEKAKSNEFINFVSLEKNNVNMGNDKYLVDDEACIEAPLSVDLSMGDEEKSVSSPEEETKEENENIINVETTVLNSLCEDINIENGQSFPDVDMTDVNQEETPSDKNLVVDTVVNDSTKETFRIDNEIDDSSKTLAENRNVCEDVVSSIDYPVEQVPREELEKEEEKFDESGFETIDNLPLSEVAAVDGEKPFEQAEPETKTVNQEESDLVVTDQIQQTETDAILETIHCEEPADIETHDQDDSVVEVKILRENEDEESVDTVKDTTTTQDEHCKNEIINIEENNEKEGMEGKVVDTHRQNEEGRPDLDEESFNRSEETLEDELLTQNKVKVAIIEREKVMEVEQKEMSNGTDCHVVTSSEPNVPEHADLVNQSLTEDILNNKDIEINIKDQEIQMTNGEKAEEEIFETVSQNENQETSSSKTESGNNDVGRKSDSFSLCEPIKPTRPSRLKKQSKNNHKKSENIAMTKLPDERETEKLSEEEESYPSKAQPVGQYENVVLEISNKEDVKEDDTLFESVEDSERKDLKKPDPGYENVILSNEDNNAEPIPESDSPGNYQVPRRSSFHSHTLDEKIVRKTRSSSFGSLERKPKSEYKEPKPRSKTETEDIYVVPKSNRPASSTSGTEETYVVPKSIIGTSPIQATPISGTEYHVPQSLVREEATEAEYKVPSRTRLEEEEGLYSVPKSPVSVPRGTRIAQLSGSEEEEGLYSMPKSPVSVPRGTRVAQLSGSEEGEGVYSVPTSPVSVPRQSHVETQRVSHPSESEEENVYSVPSTSVPVTTKSEPSSDPNDPGDERFKRSSRSSVMTSRSELPASLKNSPPKPPRESLKLEAKTKDNDINSVNGSALPIPVPRTAVKATNQSPEVKPRAIPRPKQRQGQDNSNEKVEDEIPAPSPPKDQSQSSPKPKRPAPPRPKAPAVSPLTDKENEVTVKSEEKKQAAPPPRPPPPSANRTSFAPSEQDSISSTTGFPSESSESDSEEEVKPPMPTGPPKKKTYHIAHEILSTEKTFVNALTLCYEDCYGLIRKADVVPEATLNDIFKDLGNIYQLDCKFLQELEERMKTWDEHERIGDIVKKYGHFLKMYTTYINNYDKAMNVLQETTKENLQFAELVQQFQASKKCKGLFLVSFMLKPVQRIPSYRLLLKDYLKHLTPDSDEFKDIQVALEIVSEVATHINESMKKADNFERVLTIQQSIVGNEEIVKPGRDFIKEGVLKKLCRKDMQERMFFLLTDVLLYTAPVGNTQYKLKEKLPLLGMKVTLPESPDFENEFSIISKMRSFTLSASTPSERDEWIEELNNAINAVTTKRSTFLVGTIPKLEAEEESKLGEKAPVWIPDARVTMCMLCTDNFTVTNRRHHCRGCGKVVCGSCSDNLAPLAYLDYVQARVCEVCYDFLLKEQNRSETNNDLERLPVSPIGMTSDDLDRIHRKPPKFEILHRFKPGSKTHRRKSKAFGRPSVCTEVVGHESGSQMSGYLKFKRTNKHGWKRLWFVLKDNVLYTYKASEDVVAIETIPILGYNVQEATRTDDEIQFQLKHAGLPPVTFKTESESSVSRWIQELKKATTL